MTPPPPILARPLLLAVWMAALPAVASPAVAQKTVSPPEVEAPAADPGAPARPDSQDFSYIRFADDDSSSRLELAVRSFARDEGTLVDLVSVVHIADESYYQALNRRLAEYDVVLYELVGDPFGEGDDAAGDAAEKPGSEAPAVGDGNETDAVADEGSEAGESAGDAAPAEPEASGSEIGFSILRVLYTAVGKFLHLSFQLQCIDYTPTHFVHADVSREEFAAMQDEQGESLATLMARAMEVQGADDTRDAVRDLQEFNPVRLMTMLFSPQAADDFKRILARVMAGSEKSMAKAEEENATVILTRRNEVAVAKLREVLERSPQPRRIAVFYGAAHMTGIGADLERSLGFRPAGVVWLPAWTMPHPGAEKPAPSAGETPAEPAQ